VETQKSFYTMDEIAGILRVSVETARAYTQRKKDPLPCYRVGRQYLVDKVEFEKWMREKKNIQGA
jgi:excisionase family DNA binding protein